MARSVGTQVENNFTKGLITENTALNFPENGCTDTLNCVFDETGRVTRRTEFDLEPRYTVGPSLPMAPGAVYTEFLWTAVAGLGTKSFLVQQQGNVLHFYDVSNNVDVSINKHADTVNLTTYKATGTPNSPEGNPCSFTQGDGKIFVVNRACTPIYCSFDPDTDAITATAITVKYRDFIGVPYGTPSTYVENYRPPFANIAAMQADGTDGVFHFYNLLNQGWWNGVASGGIPDANSALGQWDTARADMPSNQDVVSYYRASETDPFDNARVLAYTQGNTLAPKGHFILNLGEADRASAAAQEGYTVSFSNSTASVLAQNLGTVIGVESNGTAITTVLSTVGTSTWVVPVDWNNSVNTITLWGGGGGGGASAAYRGGGGGGGGGGRRIISNLSLTPGSSVSRTIGAGGARGVVNQDGGDGGTTSFNGQTATGGSGGNADNAQSGAGDGGNGGTGTTTGSSGHDGNNTPGASDGGGDGGASPGGGAGGDGGTNASSGPGGSDGSNGSAPGGGGGGGGGQGTGGTHNGGVGARGQITITYTPSSVGAIDRIFDGDSTSGSTTCAFRTGLGYVGKDLLAGKAIYKVQVYGYANTDSKTLTLRGKNTLPANASDGVSLGTTTLTTADSMVTINSNDKSTTYQYVWIQVSGGTASTNVTLREMYIFEAVTDDVVTTDDVTPERPTHVAFFASRVWYAGTTASALNNNVYFSQVVEGPGQYGKCYQTNDPTSEILFDILPSDGGVIRIPEMGKVVKLYNYQTSLLVFATNGVWIIQGGSGGFSATDYSIRRISSLGSQSPHSFVDIKGLPLWWGENGILRIDYNPQFDSFSVESITDQTIRNFITDIPADNRRYVKGAYDALNSVVYWMYDDREDTSPYLYTRVLCLNVLSGAFYPWEISNSVPRVRGIVYTFDSIGITDPLIKYTTTINVDASNEYLTFSENSSNAHYYDWYTYGNEIGTESDMVSYDSYAVSGYKIHGEAQRFFQPNYVIVYLESEEDSSCFMQGIFDFTNSGASGKWSTKQQVYNSILINRDVKSRRLKVRGKGRSLQFKFTSEEGKPFTIIGWSTLESANAAV
jgi:hypothetical protein